MFEHDRGEKTSVKERKKAGSLIATIWASPSGTLPPRRIATRSKKDKRSGCNKKKNEKRIGTISLKTKIETNFNPRNKGKYGQKMRFSVCMQVKEAHSPPYSPLNFMLMTTLLFRMLNVMFEQLVGFFAKRLMHCPFGGKEQKDEQRATASRPMQRTRRDLHRQLYDYLCQHYQLRYNLLSEQAEFRPIADEGQWRAVDQRAFNTLTMAAVDEGMGTWSLDMQRLLCSEWLPAYHPLRDYMDRLPEWDGQDRLTPLAQRISQEPTWLLGFRVWMRALAAQWMGEERITANALVPLLVSQQQGMRKSSFVRLLMPQELLPYFSDKFDLTSTSGCEQRLARLGLISLDEFDRYTPRQMATLKNLLQLRQLTIRRQFTQQLIALPRMASFIGTSNELELLEDLTGSRRFLCAEVNRPIDCSPIDHAQLFAQLRHEVVAGHPTHLTRSEEREVEVANLRFRRTPPAAEIFSKVFAPAQQGEGELLSATEIFLELQHDYPAALRGQNPSRFGRILRSLGLQAQRTARANSYWVLRKEKEE